MNLLLVDSTVNDYEVFVNSVNANTTPVVYFPNTTRQELLAALNGPIERIAVVSHTHTFIERESLFSDSNVELFRTIIETHQVKHIDYLACNTLQNPEWSEYFKKIPCVIGASNDETGNLKYGGDWIMESTSEDIEAIYFTQSIEYYQYLLSDPFHTIIIKDGLLYGTGRNNFGQLGVAQDDVDNRTILTPMLNDTGKTPKSISCGRFHTIVLMTDGTLYGTGYNSNGQLGVAQDDVDDRTILTPMLNDTGKTPKSISCGVFHTIVLMTDGTLYGTGNNSNGQLGVAQDDVDDRTILTPMLNNTGKRPKSISCGQTITFVLMTDGAIYGTGENAFGQLGVAQDDVDDRTILTPMLNNTGETPKSIATGGVHTIVLMTNGAIYGTGYNAYGQLGVAQDDVDNRTVLTPMLNDTGKRPNSISCTARSTFILMTDGALYGTGYNAFGQLGVAQDDVDNRTVLTYITDSVTNVADMIKYLHVIGISLTYNFTGPFLFTLPVFGDYTDIDWGDDTYGTSSDTQHQYDTGGIKTVVVTGSNLRLSHGDGTGLRNTACTYLTSCDAFSGASSFEFAFAGCSNLESVPTELPSSITNMAGMFYGASAFNQDIGEWNTSKVETMYQMFNGATAFDKNIGIWDFSTVGELHEMFDNSGLSTDTYDAMLTSLNANESLTTRLLSGPLTIGVAGLTYTNITDHDDLVGKGLSFDGDAISLISLTYNFPGPFLFTLPVFGDYTDIDWGDDTHGTSSDTQHTYETGDTYTVVVTGSNLRLIHYNNTARTYLTSCNNFSGVISLENAFYGCSNLVSVPAELPSSITNIKEAFRDASKFNRDISGWDTSNVTDMEQLFRNASAFNQNIGTWNFTKVEDLNYMFDYSGLKTSTYNAMLTSLNANESLTTRLQSTELPTLTIGVVGLTYTNTTDRTELFGKGLSFDGDEQLVYNISDGILTSVTVTNLDTYDLSDLDITSVGTAFQGLGLSSITFPSTLTTIEGYAFYNCTSLSSLTFPSTLTTIGGDAFYGTLIETINLSSTGITTLSENQFNGMSHLKTIDLSYTSSLSSINFGGLTVETVTLNGSGLTTIGSSAFANCTSLSSIILPSSLTSIVNKAFRDCDSLTTVTFTNPIGTNVTIGDYAFQNCELLSTVTFPPNLTSIGKSAFQNCVVAGDFTFSNVTTIGQYAFQNNKLLTVSLPAAAATGNYSFSYNTRLSKVTL